MNESVPRNIRIIDPEAICENMRTIRKQVPPEAKVLAVVKADAYGHGAYETSLAALRGGADMLAVAAVQEGVQLRQKGITAPILVLGAVTEADVTEGTEYGLIQTVCTPDMVCLCEKAGIETGKQTEVHLKIDTGMGRIGIRNEAEKKAVTEEIRRSPHVKLTGAFTHFSDADGDEDGLAYTRNQYRMFRELTKDLGDGMTLHCANSAAIHRFPEMAMSMVRAGISLYGYPPVPEGKGLKPCMEWRAKISHIKTVPAGTDISYGRTFRTEKETKVATITCGYADGYHRAASGKAEVLIRGKRYRIIGRICMDQMMADITGSDDIRVDDPVILMGQSGNEAITAEDLARWSGTISYEILLSVGSRVARVFKQEGMDSK